MLSIYPGITPADRLEPAGYDGSTVQIVQIGGGVSRRRSVKFKSSNKTGYWKLHRGFVRYGSTKHHPNSENPHLYLGDLWVVGMPDRTNLISPGRFKNCSTF